MEVREEALRWELAEAKTEGQWGGRGQRGVRSLGFIVNDIEASKSASSLRADVFARHRTRQKK